MTRTKTTVLAMAIAIVFTALAATGAAAGPKACADLPPDHPNWCPPISTSTTVPTTTIAPELRTCAERDPSFPAKTNAFVVQDAECVDWTTTHASHWLVTVEPPAGASRVALFVKAADIGDFCWTAYLGRNEIKNGAVQLTISFTDQPLPASTVGACGPDDDSADSFVFRAGARGTTAPVAVTVEPLP